MPRYQWSNPQEWLLERAERMANHPAELLSIVQSLVHIADAGTIQDEFQSDMEAGGYFVAEP